jgi:hypothetical protein
MKNLIAIALLVCGTTASAFADGVNKPRIHTPVPSPLQVTDNNLAGGPNSPAVHRVAPVKRADCDCGSKKTGQQVQLDGDFTGGVGAGIATNWLSGNGFVSPVYPMVRSRSSVLYHPASAYTVRPRTYKIIRRQRR